MLFLSLPAEGAVWQKNKGKKSIKLSLTRLHIVLNPVLALGNNKYLIYELLEVQSAAWLLNQVLKNKNNTKSPVCNWNNLFCSFTPRLWVLIVRNLTQSIWHNHFFGLLKQYQSQWRGLTQPCCFGAQIAYKDAVFEKALITNSSSSPRLLGHRHIPPVTMRLVFWMIGTFT